MSQNFLPAYFYLCENDVTGIVKNAVERLKTQLKDVIDFDWDFFTFESKTLDKDSLTASLEGFPIGGKYRLTIIFNSEELNTEIASFILEYLESANSHSILVLCASKIGNCTKIKTKINKIGGFTQLKQGTTLDYQPPPSVFKLIDAIAEKNTQSAFGLLDKVIIDSPELAIIELVKRQFRLISSAIIEKTENKTTTFNDIASKLNIQPFVAQKILNQSRLYRDNDLVKIFELIQKTELAAKSGINPRFALEKLIIDLGEIRNIKNMERIQIG